MPGGKLEIEKRRGLRQRSSSVGQRGFFFGSSSRCAMCELKREKKKIGCRERAPACRGEAPAHTSREYGVCMVCACAHNQAGVKFEFIGRKEAGPEETPRESARRTQSLNQDLSAIWGGDGIECAADRPRSDERKISKPGNPDAWRSTLAAPCPCNQRLPSKHQQQRNAKNAMAFFPNKAPSASPRDSGRASSGRRGGSR